MRTTSLFLLLLLLPLPGCLESPCSRYGELCNEGGPPGPGPETCEVLPEVASGDLSDDDGDSADVWALRVDANFQEVQIRDVVNGWNPTGRAWVDASDPHAGGDECACESDAGCPSMQVIVVGSPTWVFVEIYDLRDDEITNRSYTLHARGVLAALLLRDGVSRAEDAQDYKTSQPGLCAPGGVGSDVQLPWRSEEQGGGDQWLGDLTAPGMCVLGTCYDDSGGDDDDADFYGFQKTDDNPTRITLLWNGEANLGLYVEPGGEAFTDDNPETFVASIPSGTEGWIGVDCSMTEEPLPYALAIETY